MRQRYDSLEMPVVEGGGEAELQHSVALEQTKETSEKATCLRLYRNSRKRIKV